MTESYGDRLARRVDMVYAAQTSEGGNRFHLGASVIGDPCMRQIFYKFRWAASEDWIGRMLRLVHHGQREEDIFVDILRRVGAVIFTKDAKTGKQFRFSEWGGHFSGSCDGVGYNFPEIEDQALLLEFKTYNNKWFTKLKKEGVTQCKPSHYKQMQVYMHKLELKRALYCAVNKDTHELYFELVDYSEEVAAHMFARAETIIFGKGLPPRISNNPSWYECSFCSAREVCFGLTKTDRVNCRTCQHSKPEREGGWSCALSQPEIKDSPKVGCARHEFMEELK